MGLDFVEIVLELEENFGIQIPDEDAAKLTTVGSLIGYIAGRTTRSAAEDCTTGHTFYGLRRELTRLTGTDRQRIRPSTRLADVMLRPDRAAIWRELARRSYHLPALRLTAERRWSIVLGVTLATGVVFFFDHRIAIIALVLWIILACIASHWFSSELPSSVVTVGDLARYADRTQPSDYEGIAIRVRQILSEQADVPIDMITDDKHIVRDLFP